jgi:large subunit ribosomal protein L14e
MVSYVKVGRLAKVLRGPRKDRVGVITAIIDQNRVLIENPHDEKMWRHVQSLQNIEPTKFAVQVGINASTKSLTEALAKKDIIAAYNKSGKAKAVVAAHALAASTDFERYQLRVAKRSRAHWSRKIFQARDAKESISFEAKRTKKIEKKNAKFEKKGLKARHERIKKHFTARKAKKGSKAGKKK